MQLEHRSFRSLRGALLAASAIAAFPMAAMAADLPATAEGAAKLSAVLEKYAGKPAAGAAPGITVTLEGGHYTLAFDMAALSAPFKTYGFSYDPAVIKYTLTEQDDGLWRFEYSALPPLTYHSKDAVVTINLTDYKGTGIFDPVLAWVKSSHAGIASGRYQVKAPNVDAAVDLGAIGIDMSGAASANGAVSGTIHEEIGKIAGVITVTPGGADPKGADAKPDAKPVTTNFHVDKGAADIALDGLKMHPLLDLWAFAVAHPSRPELAANEAAFKDLLRAALPGAFKISEAGTIGAISVETQQGIFKAASGKVAVAAAGSGPTNTFEEHFAVDGLALPAGLVPPAYAALTPSAVDIGVKVSGFDLQAGANEAINDMHLAGDGPAISPDDDQKVGAKFKGAGPIVIEIPLSHILAPQLDIAFEGKINWDGARPTGTMTVHVKNFDKTVAALKGLGPAASPQVLAGLTMAKGLAKTDADGALTWVGEMGADGAMKVNGLALGKAPM